MNGYDKLEIDSPLETYDALAKYARTLKGVPGLSCEIGLRRAGGTVVMLDAFLENGDPRTHVALDPYGNIIYTDIVGPHRSDYTNSMRNSALADLYRYAGDKGLNILFFNLEDSEFYKRFSDGVPVYDEEKKIVNEYCMVHVDGQHDLASVTQAANFFIPRISQGGIIAFDNTNHYNHAVVHTKLLAFGYEEVADVHCRKFYRNTVRCI